MTTHDGSTWISVVRHGGTERSQPTDHDYRKVDYGWLHSNEANRQNLQDALARSHRKAIYCLCKTPNPRLVIYSRGSEVHPTYTVSNYKGSGSTHHKNCNFYEDTYLGGELEDRYQGAIAVGTDGKMSIRLNFAVTSPTTPPLAPAAVTPQAPRARARPGEAGLRSVLLYLAERARLNVWDGPDAKPRDRDAVARRIYMAATETTIARQPLAKTLITVPSPVDKDRFDAGLRRAFAVGRSEKRLIFIMTITPAARRPDLLEHLGEPASQHALRLQITDDARAATARSYARELNYTRGNLLILAAGAIVGLNQIEISHLGLIACTDTFVPIDSLYEMTLADQLVAAQRSFIKPLRADNNADFPDFILEDTKPRTVMEVFGRDDPDYRLRADTKKKRSIWFWDATTQRTPPQLPPPTPQLGTTSAPPPTHHHAAS
jgi:hypothetical protein